MRIALLCGYFEPMYENVIKEKTKTWIENAANIFQQRLINGVQQHAKLHIISAPFVAPWPKGYQDIYVSKYASEYGIEYVSFNNIWGYRNFSRGYSLKRSVKRFLSQVTDEPCCFLVYSPHTPLLEAAVYAKKLRPDTKICLIAPDLPQYMNLRKDHRKIYDFFKKYDIKRFNQLSDKVDTFVVLTKYMLEALSVKERPAIVVEGIAEISDLKPSVKRSSKRVIAYAGRLQEAFGVHNLLQAFLLMPDKSIELVICGDGELRPNIQTLAAKDARIKYKGVVSSLKAAEILRDADVLVNPRLNNEEYTKYSFPSKNIEYLLTGNTVVGYMLDGMPDVYSNFMIIPESDTVDGLKTAILRALHEPAENQLERQQKAWKYLSENRTSIKVGQEILKLNGISNRVLLKGEKRDRESIDHK